MATPRSVQEFSHIYPRLARAVASDFRFQRFLPWRVSVSVVSCDQTASWPLALSSYIIGVSAWAACVCVSATHIMSVRLIGEGFECKGANLTVIPAGWILHIWKMTSVWIISALAGTADPPGPQRRTRASNSLLITLTLPLQLQNPPHRPHKSASLTDTRL